jgi:hypothetical protein
MKKGPEGPITTRLSKRANVYEVGVSIEWIFRARVRAQMNASRPEAETEYSRGRRARRGTSEGPEARWHRRFETHRTGVLALGLLGVALLVAAEFTPLLHVHAAAHAHLARTVTTGSNHSYALLPVAALAAGLAFTTWRSGSRFALLAIGLLGLLTIAIALLGDLPATHSTGLVGTSATGLSTATSSPAIGLFLETGGGLVLLLGAAAGMLLEPVPDVGPGVPEDGPQLPDDTSAPRTRSAS